MSRKGNCWDNAVAESFFKTLKIERAYRRHILLEMKLKWIFFNISRAGITPKEFIVQIIKNRFGKFMKSKKNICISNVA